MDTTTAMSLGLTPATDPVPFILAAYTIGAAAILGFTFWIGIERKKLQSLLVTVRNSNIRTKKTS
jgi:hypothetical protein